MTREERRSLHLHRVIAERLRSDPDLVVHQARLNLRRIRAGASKRSQPLREWGVILDRPVASLAEVLTDPSPWGRKDQILGTIHEKTGEARADVAKTLDQIADDVNYRFNDRK